MKNRMVATILPEAQLESVDYQNGVIAGYHECGADIAVAAIAPQRHHVPGTCELWRAVARLRKGKEAWRPRDWFLGFVVGYLVRRENERLWVEARLRKEETHATPPVENP